MIKTVRRGNLLESGAQTLVNTVNTVGVMGKGIALEFKRRYPDMFADYQRRCAEGAVRLGEPYLWRGLLEPWIVNFPTKEHWRSASRIADIERGLAFLADHIERWGVASLAVPPLGAGSGGLDWVSIGPTLYRHLEALPIPVLLYVPFDVPDEQATVEFLAMQDQPMDHGEQGCTRTDDSNQAGWLSPKSFAGSTRSVTRGPSGASVSRKSPTSPRWPACRAVSSTSRAATAPSRPIWLLHSAD